MSGLVCSEHPLKLIWYQRATPCCGVEIINLFYEQDEAIPCVCGQWMSTPRYSPKGRTPDVIQMSEN